MTINARLLAAQQKGCLSTADMTTWFECNRGTMRTWLNGVVPGDHRQTQIETNLTLLEKAVEDGKYFPVPLSITQFKRKEYIQGVKNGVAGRVPTSRSAKRGAALLGSTAPGQDA